MSLKFFENMDSWREHQQTLDAIRSAGTSREKYNNLVDEYNELLDQFKQLRSSQQKTISEKEELTQKIQSLGSSLEQYKKNLERAQKDIQREKGYVEKSQDERRFHEREGDAARDSGYLAALVERRIADDVSVGFVHYEASHFDLYKSYMEAIVDAERSLRIEYARIALSLLGKSDAEIEQIIEEDNHAIMDDINAQYAEGLQKIREESKALNQSGNQVYQFIQEELSKGRFIRGKPEDMEKDLIKDQSQGAAEVLNTTYCSLERKIGNASNNDLEYQRRLNQVALDPQYRDRILFTPWHEKADAELNQGLFDFTVRPDKTIRYALAFAVLDEYFREKNGLPQLTDSVNEVWRAQYVNEKYVDPEEFTFFSSVNPEKKMIKGHRVMTGLPANVMMTPESAFHYLRMTIDQVAGPYGLNRTSGEQPYQVNTGLSDNGFDGNGYLFHLIYAGVKGSALGESVGLRNGKLNDMIYSESTLNQLAREYNWMMPLAAQEFANKIQIIAPSIDVSHLLGDQQQVKE